MRVAAALLGCFALGSVACSAEKEPPGQGEIARGMTKKSEDGLLSVTIADADPIPPLQGINRWTVDLTNDGNPVVDMGDEALPDSQVIANIYMVEHDHNLRKVGTMVEPGTFEIEDFTLTMNGYWEVTIEAWPDVPANDDDHEDVVFGFHVRN